ncbi:hypothetical protein COOONC_27552 [Cooperia oncophora]
MASCMLRLALVLSTIAAAVVHGHVLSATLNKALAGEWVALEGAKNESMVKVIRVRDIIPPEADHFITFEMAEQYCKNQSSHLVSIHNKDEENFITGPGSSY